MKKHFCDMTDDEAKAAVRAIYSTCTANNQVEQQIRDELGHTGTIVVDSHLTRSGGLTTRKFLVVLRGLSGSIFFA